VGEQGGADRGQFDRPWSTRAVEQAMADDALERGDLLADRRLAEPEAIGSAAEGAFGGDGLQRLEVADLDVVEADRLHK
jgi:hypothetical protein